MEIAIFILFSIIAILSFILLEFILGSCKVSGNCSREEEYRKLDPKELDNNEKWDNDIYDEDFIKKEDVNGN